MYRSFASSFFGLFWAISLLFHNKFHVHALGFQLGFTGWYVSNTASVQFDHHAETRIWKGFQRLRILSHQSSRSKSNSEKLVSMSKLNLDFVIVDEQVNDYGYRVLMSGYRPGRFESNPVLLLMHERATRGLLGDPLEEDVVLPLGRWNNIRVENGQLVGQPEFDDQDEMAQKVQNTGEKGYMNAASAWTVPIAISDDPALMLPGQTGPTVTQWEIAEASIVDIPGCKNALAIRENEKLIRQSKETASVFKLKLEKFLHPQSDTMDFLKLAAKLVGLPDTATSRE